MSAVWATLIAVLFFAAIVALVVFGTRYLKRSEGDEPKEDVPSSRERPEDEGRRRLEKDEHSRRPSTGKTSM